MKKREPLLVTMTQLAELIGVSSRTIRRMEKQQQLPPRVLFGSRKLVLFRYDHVVEWIDQHTKKQVTR